MPLNNDIFRSVFDTALDTMIITNSKGEILDINQSGCDLFGYPKNELLGKKIHDLVDKDMRSEFTQKWRKFKHDGAQRGETDFICADGIRRTVEYHATADFIPGRMLAVLRDVSERKLQSKQRERLLSIASHELKTPLTTMKAFTHILKKKFKELPPEKITYYLSRIDQKTDALTRLINDLLDVTRIRQGKLELYPSVFDISILLAEIINELQLTTAQPIVMRNVVSTEVVGDRSRITQVITNLLRNARKYSPKKKKIIISTKKNSNTITVMIQDFGIGIPKRQQNKVFDLYFRGNNSESTSITGLGVGLYISSQIIKQHSGKMGVTSNLGKGSTFFFTLPLAQED